MRLKQAVKKEMADRLCCLGQAGGDVMEMPGANSAEGQLQRALCIIVGRGWGEVAYVSGCNAYPSEVCVSCFKPFGAS